LVVSGANSRHFPHRLEAPALARPTASHSDLPSHETENLSGDLEIAKGVLTDESKRP
jgi:hypothetical protein